MALKLTALLLVLLLVTPIVRAQSLSVDESTKSEKEKARAEREKKALALAEEVIKETQSLRLPENRIRVDIALADSLWSRDEPRARSLLKDAITSLSEIAAAIDSGDRAYSNLTHLPAQLRQEVLQVAANHDPKLALDFLRASRPTSSEQQSYAQPDFEAQLELRLAMQLAAKNPAEALSIAEDSLKQGIDYQATNFLYTLQSKDKTAAEKFLGDILNRIRTDDLSRTPASLNAAMNLLRAWTESNRPASGQPTFRTTVNVSLTGLNEQVARELSSLIVNAVMNTAVGSVRVIGKVVDSPISGRIYPGQMYGLLQQLRPMLSDIERLSPDQIPALRARLAEFDKLNEIQQGPWARYQQLVQTGTADDLLEASKNAPPEVVNNLIQQAAWKAFSQGDASHAREIVEKITNPQQRRDMMLNLDRQMFNRASDQQKLAEVRSPASRFLLEERVGILCQIAGSASSKGDKSTALQLLGEAQALLGNRALSYPQLAAQLQIARLYQQLNSPNGAVIVGTAIEQLNELVAAAVVLNGFDLQQYFRDGEFIVSGGNQLSQIFMEFARGIGSAARTDFDQARLMAEQFQRPEMRVMALVQTVQGGLASDER
jgi:hypothetical protein